MELHLLPRVPSFAIRHQLQEGATRRTTPRAPSLATLHRQQEGVPRSASTRPSSKLSRMPWTSMPKAYVLYQAHQGTTRKMQRWTTTCHQALVEAPRKGRQGNKHADVNMRRNIQMTFDDTLPLKSVNVDMRRSQEPPHPRWRRVHILWCLLQGPPLHGRPSQALLMNWPLH